MVFWSQLSRKYVRALQESEWFVVIMLSLCALPSNESFPFCLLFLAAKERILGWYSTGPKILPADLGLFISLVLFSDLLCLPFLSLRFFLLSEINEVVRRYCPNPILVVVEVNPTDELSIPTQAYCAVQDMSEVSFPDSLLSCLSFLLVHDHSFNFSTCLTGAKWKSESFCSYSFRNWCVWSWRSWCGASIAWCEGMDQRFFSCFPSFASLCLRGPSGHHNHHFDQASECQADFSAATGGSFGWYSFLSQFGFGEETSNQSNPACSTAGYLQSHS